MSNNTCGAPLLALGQQGVVRSTLLKLALYALHLWLAVLFSSLYVFTAAFNSLAAVFLACFTFYFSSHVSCLTCCCMNCLSHVAFLSHSRYLCLHCPRSWHSRGGKRRSCEPAFPPLQPLHPRGMPRGRGGRTPKKGGRNKDSS